MEAVVNSDHAPLYLSLLRKIARNRGRARFRYEAGWGLEEGCKEVISRAWSQVGTLGVSWERLDSKLQACKRGLGFWIHSKQGTTKTQIQRMSHNLAELQGKEDGDYSADIAKLKHDLQVQMADKDDLWWKQRAREEWLKLGDRNTKYYHAKR